MNRNLKALSLLGALVVNSAFATEWRTPWISERGPLRYTFEKLHDEEGKSNLNWWSAIHTKEAHKAFLKHGTKTQPLTALIFNKSDFALKEAFPNSDVPLTSENFNPFVRTASISPRVKYLEYGMTFGGRWDYPVWGNKGRIGLRGTVPVRRIEMQREDIDDPNANPLDEVFDGQVKKVTRTTNEVTDAKHSSNGKLAVTTVTNDIVTRAWRFDFVQSIPNPDRTSIVTFAADNVMIFGSLISDNTVQTDDTVLKAPVEANVTVGFTGVGAGIEGDKPQTASFQFTDESMDKIGSQNSNKLSEQRFPGGPQATVTEFNQLAAAPVKTPLAAIPGDKVSWFAPGVDYRGYDLNNTDNNPFFVKPFVAPATGTTSGCNPCPTVCAPECAPKICPPVTCPTSCPVEAGSVADMWLIFRYDAASTNGDKICQSRAKKIADIIDARAKAFTESPTEFLEDAGIDFDSHTRSGLGDIDLDLFYEHTFGSHLIGELMIGARFPTGGKASVCTSPYAPQLGNNNHFEVKIGGDLAWKLANWLNVKFDAYYSFVIEATEDRLATFQGAQIKNLGPCTKADVDWGYFVGRVDFTIFHPKTSDVRSSIGYEFYYKTKDDVDFKCKKLASFLGKQLDTDSTSATFGQFIANCAPLDTCLAEKNTESIGHKVRGETSCQINKWFEIFLGGSFTFAGQNVFADRDAHAGFNIRF